MERVYKRPSPPLHELQRQERPLPGPGHRIGEPTPPPIQHEIQLGEVKEAKVLYIYK